MQAQFLQREIGKKVVKSRVFKIETLKAVFPFSFIYFQFLGISLSSLAPQIQPQTQITSEQQIKVQPPVQTGQKSCIFQKKNGFM